MARRKEERSPVSRSRHLEPGGPRGLHLKTIRRKVDTNNWRPDRKMMMTQGGREGERVWANVLQDGRCYHCK